MPRSKTGKKRPLPDKVAMEAAVNFYLSKPADDKCSLRLVAQQFNVKKTTLDRCVKNAQAQGVTNFRYEPQVAHKRVFSLQEENALKDYLLKASKMHYGLTLIQARQLAYKYAAKNKKTSQLPGRLMRWLARAG